jgi:hypothetical protein
VQLGPGVFQPLHCPAALKIKTEVQIWGVQVSIGLMGMLRRWCPNQALEETFLVARLALALYSYLGLGTRWTGKLLRLMVYATLLLPGFIQARPRCAATLCCHTPAAAAASDSRCGGLHLRLRGPNGPELSSKAALPLHAYIAAEHAHACPCCCGKLALHCGLPLIQQYEHACRQQALLTRDPEP